MHELPRTLRWTWLFETQFEINRRTTASKMLQGTLQKSKTGETAKFNCFFSVFCGSSLIHPNSSQNKPAKNMCFGSTLSKNTAAHPALGDVVNETRSESDKFHETQPKPHPSKHQHWARNRTVRKSLGLVFPNRFFWAKVGVFHTLHNYKSWSQHNQNRWKARILA